jgi:hypothetical protein
LYLTGFEKHLLMTKCGFDINLLFYQNSKPDYLIIKKPKKANFLCRVFFYCEKTNYFNRLDPNIRFKVTGTL